MIKLAAFVAACLIAFALPIEAYRIYKATTVNCRSGPNTSSKVVRTYDTNDNISLTCQTSGNNINGNTLWDKTTDDCYVSDYYLQTGSNGYVAKHCDSSSGGSCTSSVPGPIEDDYPYPSQCDGVDPWNYYKCQCTSFVAW
ncbi:hypothetical protein EDC05_006501, partial [Coemansia umbellata]